MKYFIIPLLFFFITPVSAQLCTNSLGDPVINVTFGKGQTPFDFGTQLPAGTTTLNYVKNRCPVNGEYSIVAGTSGCFGQWHTASDHTLNADGTKNSTNGYFMLIDASFTPDDFYVQTVTGLCPGTTYQFGAWIINMFNIAGGIKPNITFTIEQTDGTVLASYVSGDIPVITPLEWKQYSFFFVTPPATTSVVLRMRNNAPGGGGNDLGLDDITFRPAGPNITLSLPGITGDSAIVCADASDSLHFSASVENCYINTAYQWQASKDSGLTWVDIAGAVDTSYSISKSAAGTYFYRLAVAQVGSMGITGCRVFSGSFKVIISALVTSSVNISASTGSSICAGSPVVFTATAINGGNSPVYQWKLNNVNVGANSSTYANNALSNNDVVSCELTSSLSCTVPVNSNIITIAVKPVVTPGISITASSTMVCAGTPVFFTALATNGGASPVYQWKVNGINTGTGSVGFNTTSLVNGDIVTCILTSDAACATSATAISNSILMSSNVPAAPAVVIAADTNNVCPGTSILFTAVQTNGGTAPAFAWKVNGISVGNNTADYLSNTLVNGDIVTCALTSNGTCVASVTVNSNPVTVKINAAVTPSVTITSNLNNICPGIPVTFTATAANGGSAPVYQWKINGRDAGTNNPVFSSATLANGEVITCSMTGNAACATTSAVTSNAITMLVKSAVTPFVTITGTNSVCAGSAVTFAAAPVNGGITPVFQWKVNGINVGVNTATFTGSTLVNGDIISCSLTSSLACAASIATSNTIVMNVTALVVPEVSISVDTNNVCSGYRLTFTASSSNGGTAPVFQWKLNGNNTGGNGPVYSGGNFTNGDVVTCTLTSNYTPCLSTSQANSNAIKVLINPIVIPAVSIAADLNNICPGTPVTFTATAQNGGSSPVFQWKVNGNQLGNNSASFTSATLSNGDIISCTMISNATCVQAATTISNEITLIIKVPPVVAVNITGSINGICTGTSVTFKAIPVNGGTAPVYQWSVNGVGVGTNSAAFQSKTLTNGDMVSCRLISSLTCSTPVSSAGILMQVYPRPAIDMPFEKTIDRGNSIQIIPAITGEIRSYTWLPPDGLNNNTISSPVASPVTTTRYTLKVVSIHDCADSAAITVKVLVPIVVPNAFSPNGDGVNDLWNIRGLAEYNNCTVDIFTRYGQLVFHENGYNRAWDGTNKGKPLPVGEYYYIINPNNGLGKLTGGLLLLR